MYIKLNVDIDFEIKSLSDLPKFKQVMEQLSLKLALGHAPKKVGTANKPSVDDCLRNIRINGKN
ncbi:hypothetical protein OQZ55_04430 [Bacillus subtilis]|uniref:hypothetical protein n=1 Tax=Bacillaceae TaxID=186817 RepID=UPI000EF225CB|nr:MULTISPECIES: hypothetical protein [Bacillaceae]AYK56001.1 hypothetical protein D9C10_01640 [Bacillus subtilis subsp. subtilis]MCT6514638.1 hypothetical protein [Bacillus subtilis]MCX4075491.1 hypothetical protein [Bacillus subtilis]UJZ87192.1 hypothetical protein L3V65_13295 [Heyndrickxia coagulans]WRU06564.1 hypothetical protein VDS58_04130 [Bacillus subtilis]